MTQKKKILVVDDEAAIRKLLTITLKSEGYAVIESPTAQDGIRNIIATRPDIVILDLGLPDMDGCDLVRHIRDWTNVPIIVLTVRDDDDSKVKALDAGADDYLTKPFSSPELLARIRVAERHSQKLTSEINAFSSGQLKVDLIGRIVYVSGAEIYLTATEYNILKLLIQHAGKVVTHRHILNAIWGPHAVEHTQYLRVYMGHLRKKIETPTSEKLIHTVPGIGYRLVITD